jgi:EAL domain-containing protein (putative c-di-GMP-specific phosphodiesterase class I)/AmiR/NasT family two-component response regulator
MQRDMDSGTSIIDSADPAFKRIAVVDDDSDICDFVARVARDLGFEVMTTTEPMEFRRLCQEFKPAVVVMDLGMPGVDGVEQLRFLGAELSRTEVILMSGFDRKVLNSARQVGDQLGLSMKGVLQKPIAIEQLEEMLTTVSHFECSISARELASAIKNGEIRPHFQPKARLQQAYDRQVNEVEALVRWHHPVHGLLTPDRFIPMAEETNLLLPMTHAVAVGACRQIRDWETVGLSVSVAINIAPQLLTNLSLPDDIADLAAEHGVESSRLIIEITESGVMADVARAMDILTRFRIKGFRLSLDDFGTGFSSLIQLYRMPFGEIKIDRSFVKDVGANEEARVIVRATTELAHRLDLTVCAEGVETLEDLKFLSRTGCDKAQGYFISKPIPGEKVKDFVDGGAASETLLEQARATP